MRSGSSITGWPGHAASHRPALALGLGLILLLTAAPGAAASLSEAEGPSGDRDGLSLSPSSGNGDASALLDEPPALQPRDIPMQLDAAAVITTSNVPVAVLMAVEEGLVVRTPCGRTAAVAHGGRLVGSVDVVLDPGHGGPIDRGAIGPTGLVEGDLNLELAFATQRLLEERGTTVLLTRTADYGTTLSVRAGLADAVGARALVSIHHNAPNANPSAVPGSEVFVQTGSAESRRLGGLIWESVVDTLGEFDGIEWTSAVDAGVLSVVNEEGSDVYGMIRRPETVAVLAELGYVSNPTEEALMQSPEYVGVAAAALADAIEAYLDNPEAEGGGHVDQPRVFDPEAAPGTDECDDPPLR